jgi:hypothetical protein
LKQTLPFLGEFVVSTFADGGFPFRTDFCPVAAHHRADAARSFGESGGGKGFLCAHLAEE